MIFCLNDQSEILCLIIDPFHPKKVLDVVLFRRNGLSHMIMIVTSIIKDPIPVKCATTKIEREIICHLCLIYIYVRNTGYSTLLTSYKIICSNQGSSCIFWCTHNKLYDVILASFFSLITIHWKEREAHQFYDDLYLVMCQQPKHLSVNWEINEGSDFFMTSSFYWYRACKISSQLQKSANFDTIHFFQIKIKVWTSHEKNSGRDFNKVESWIQICPKLADFAYRPSEHLHNPIPPGTHFALTLT